MVTRRVWRAARFFSLTRFPCSARRHKSPFCKCKIRFEKLQHLSDNQLRTDATGPFWITFFESRSSFCWNTLLAMSLFLAIKISMLPALCGSQPYVCTVITFDTPSKGTVWSKKWEGSENVTKFGEKILDFCLISNNYNFFSIWAMKVTKVWKSF